MASEKGKVPSVDVRGFYETGVLVENGAEQSKIDFTEWNLLAEKQKLEKQLSEARKKKLDKARKPFKCEIKSAPSSLGKRKLSEAPEPAPKKKMKKPKLYSFFKKL